MGEQQALCLFVLYRATAKLVEFERGEWRPASRTLMSLCRRGLAIALILNVQTPGGHGIRKYYLTPAGRAEAVKRWGK
jgi:hypothetical protein